MESFSDNFLKEFALQLKNYRWVTDPFHQWSRQWEYPFTYSLIRDFINENPDNDKFVVLDAGSGATFFPYYISAALKSRLKVVCCDYDVPLRSIFTAINSKMQTTVEFQPNDIRQLPNENDCFDVIYCISVMEHTKDLERLVQEFKRVLKPNGLLIVTFDVSIDGDASIPVEKAKDLIRLLKKHLSPLSELREDILGKDFESSLTTEYVRKVDEDLLPWKGRDYTFASIIRNLLKLQLPARRFSNLSCFCGAFSKPSLPGSTSVSKSII